MNFDKFEYDKLYLVSWRNHKTNIFLASTFKECMIKAMEHVGCKSDVFQRVLQHLKDNDKERIVGLYNMISSVGIDAVYQLEQIYQKRR